MTAPYRLNAGVVVFNRQGLVLVCERLDLPGSWQFPQGGIEAGESAAAAAMRELAEETSLIGAQLLVTLKTPARYSFPPAVLQKMRARGFANAGQDMYWSLLYFDGAESEINLQTSEPEFRAYRWVTIDEAYALCVDFKKPAYAVAVREFAPKIKDFLQQM